MARLYDEKEHNFVQALAEWREVLELDKNNSWAQKRVSELELTAQIESRSSVFSAPLR
ncbi:MAG: hypothetical protein QME81_13590 [bacterium]|nr:hypothetical protein [bacterium]